MAKNPLAYARQQLAFHEAKAAKWKQYIVLHGDLFDHLPVVHLPVRERSTETPIKGAIADTQAAARLILEDAKGYVASQDLVTMLGAAGVPVGGDRPTSTLSARLSSATDIVSKRGQGYALAKYVEYEKAAGSLASDAPAAFVPNPDSAVEGGGEVAHDNT